MELVRKDNRVRCLSVESACIDLHKRGRNCRIPEAIIPGGLTGDVDVGRLIVVDGIVWEFATVGASTKVYQYLWDEWKDNDLVRSYL